MADGPRTETDRSGAIVLRQPDAYGRIVNPTSKTVDGDLVETADYVSTYAGGGIRPASPSPLLWRPAQARWSTTRPGFLWLEPR